MRRDKREGAVNQNSAEKGTPKYFHSMQIFSDELEV
jgi:hypothetical protein